MAKDGINECGRESLNQLVMCSSDGTWSGGGVGGLWPQAEWAADGIEERDVSKEEHEWEDGSVAVVFVTLVTLSQSCGNEIWCDKKMLENRHLETWQYIFNFKRDKYLQVMW